MEEKKCEYLTTEGVEGQCYRYEREDISDGQSTFASRIDCCKEDLTGLCYIPTFFNRCFNGDNKVETSHTHRWLNDRSFKIPKECSCIVGTGKPSKCCECGSKHDCDDGKSCQDGFCTPGPSGKCCMKKYSKKCYKPSSEFCSWGDRSVEEQKCEVLDEFDLKRECAQCWADGDQCHDSYQCQNGKCIWVIITCFPSFFSRIS